MFWQENSYRSISSRHRKAVFFLPGSMSHIPTVLFYREYGLSRQRFLVAGVNIPRRRYFCILFFRRFGICAYRLCFGAGKEEQDYRLYG